MCIWNRLVFFKTLFTISLHSVYNLFTFFFSNQFTLYLQPVYILFFPACLHCVCDLFTFCFHLFAFFFFHLFTLCLQPVYTVTTCLHSVYNLFTICLQPVYTLFATCLHVVLTLFTTFTITWDRLRQEHSAYNLTSRQLETEWDRNTASLPHAIKDKKFKNLRFFFPSPLNPKICYIEIRYIEVVTVFRCLILMETSEDCFFEEFHFSDTVVFNP